MMCLVDLQVYSMQSQDVEELKNADGWDGFSPGVSAKWLYREDQGGPAAVYLKLEPGARLPNLMNAGYQHIFVLEGDQYDDHGTYQAGTFRINRPGTPQSFASSTGSVALVIFEKTDTEE